MSEKEEGRPLLGNSRALGTALSFEVGWCGRVLL